MPERTEFDADTPVGNRDAVADRLTVVVSRLGRRTRPVGDELGNGSLSALATVTKMGPVRPSELARIENVSFPTVTRIVADLEGRGLIDRTADPADGRSSLLRATEMGLVKTEDVRSARTSRVFELLAEQNDDDIAAIAAALPVLEAAARSNG